jgi:hypothetical protein
MRENSVNNMAAIINKQIVTRLAENIVILDSNYFYRIGEKEKRKYLYLIFFILCVH